MLTAESVTTSDIMALIEQLETTEQNFRELNIANVDEQYSELISGDELDATDLGYQALEEDEDEDEGIPEEYQYQRLPQDAAEEYLESTTEPPVLIINPTSSARIPDADLDVIRGVMQSFALPESAVPEWAKVVPEEKWMPKLESSEDKIE
ncbi:hypothetical protein K7432_008315 [Basidiobolus ranarum]|uniref:Male-enhanced antigen 1 n=1 Tax=Basidiobolus ranarum TaxID=34480 RepID=A0ABR2WRY2_9FUNG